MKRIFKLSAVLAMGMLISLGFCNIAKAETVYIVNGGAVVTTTTENPLYYQSGPFYLNTAPNQSDSYDSWAYYQTAYSIAPGTNPYIWTNPWIYTGSAVYAPIIPSVNLQVYTAQTIPYYVVNNELASPYVYYPTYVLPSSSRNLLPYGYWY